MRIKYIIISLFCHSALQLVHFILFSIPVNAEQTDYQFKKMWPQLESPWYFDLPTDIAIDSLGNVYVADSQNYRIQKFTSNGAFITKWGSEGSGDGQFSWRTAITIDSSNNVYVADYNNNRIQKFTSDGAFITKWGGGKDLAMDSLNGLLVWLLIRLGMFM